MMRFMRNSRLMLFILNQMLPNLRAATDTGNLNVRIGLNRVQTACHYTKANRCVF